MIGLFTIVILFISIILACIIAAQLFGVFNIPTLISTGTGTSATTNTGTSAVLLPNSIISASLFFGQGSQSSIANAYDGNNLTTYWTPSLNLGGRVDLELDFSSAHTIKSFDFYQQNAIATGIVSRIDVFSSYSDIVTQRPLDSSFPGFLQTFTVTSAVGYQNFVLTAPLSNASKICLSFYSTNSTNTPLITDLRFYGN